MVSTFTEGNTNNLDRVSSAITCCFIRLVYRYTVLVLIATGALLIVNRHAFPGRSISFMFVGLCRIMETLTMKFLSVVLPMVRPPSALSYGAATLVAWPSDAP